MGHLTAALYSFQTAAIDLAINSIQLTVVDVEAIVYHIASPLSASPNLSLSPSMAFFVSFFLPPKTDHVCFCYVFFSLLSLIDGVYNTSSINPRASTVIYLHLYLFYSHNLFLSAINRNKKMKR